MNPRHLVRVAAAAVSALLVVTVATPASASQDDSSAGWLTRQLTDGLVYNAQYDFNDYGLTADTAYALREIGGHPGALRHIRAALADHVESWITGVDYGSDDVYAGSVAKAVVLAQITGADERRFGGTNLVRRLNDRVRDHAPVGRLQDESSTDYANTIGQAFAARGLARAGSPEAGQAISYLLEQQCSRGYFRLGFAPKGAKRQGCDAGTSTTSAPDTDATALAVLSLQALPRTAKTGASRHAVGDAIAWLERRQKNNGSFGGGTSTESSNANSTGLAAWALGRAGECGPARRAASWVDGLQVSGGLAGTRREGERGAIAYDRSAYRAGRNGIDDTERDQWRRATAQAAPGLTYLTCR